MKTIFPFFFLLLLLLGCQPSIHFTDTGQALEYKLGDAPLFTYNYATVYPPAGVDTVFKRSGFIHPLNTLQGETLTNLSPADHYHHYGLWYAWTKTTFKGSEVDFWNVGKKQGTVRFREFTHVSDAGFDAVLEHVAYPDTPAEEVAMIEYLEIRPGKLPGSGYYIDYITTLQCATGNAVTLECYRYGGLVIRTRKDWTPACTNFVTSEGLTRADADNSNARWAFFQGKAGKRQACILIQSFPSNLNHPEPLRVWDEAVNQGVGDMMWNFSPTKKQAYTLNPSVKLKLQYRIYILDRLINPEEAEGIIVN